MSRIYPDLEWYSKQSASRGLPVRCPYANVHTCPRYFQSLSLLGEEGITTKIEPSTDRALLEKWRSSTVWPVVNEHATAILNKNHFWTFCPEVAFDVFHLFASSLSRYAEEIDRDAGERAMVRERSSGTKDWRSSWSNVQEMHYSECSLYPQLSHQAPNRPIERPTEIVTLRPGAFGMSIDLKGLLTRIARWWLSRNAK